MIPVESWLLHPFCAKRVYITADGITDKADSAQTPASKHLKKKQKANSKVIHVLPYSSVKSITRQ